VRDQHRIVREALELGDRGGRIGGTGHSRVVDAGGIGRPGSTSVEKFSLPSTRLPSTRTAPTDTIASFSMSSPVVSRSNTQ